MSGERGKKRIREGEITGKNTRKDRKRGQRDRDGKKRKRHLGKAFR